MLDYKYSDTINIDKTEWFILVNVQSQLILTTCDETHGRSRDPCIWKTGFRTRRLQTGIFFIGNFSVISFCTQCPS